MDLTSNLFYYVANLVSFVVFFSRFHAEADEQLKREQ